MAKSVSGTVTRYLVDDLNPTGYPQVVEELSGTGVVQRQYSYGLQRISENQVISSTWTLSFYGYDGMGSVRTLTSSTGAVTDSYEYDGFGNEISSTGSTPNAYLYRGEAYDSDLGLYYLRARWMNPLTGRFMSRDPNAPQVLDRYKVPIDVKKLHKYLYAGGDPIDVIDPTGRDSILETGAIDFDIVLEVVPAVIEYACMVEFSWGLVAEGVNWAAELWTGNKEYEPVWSPPKPLTVACGVNELFGGGGE